MASFWPRVEQEGCLKYLNEIDDGLDLRAVQNAKKWFLATFSLGVLRGPKL